MASIALELSGGDGSIGRYPLRVEDEFTGSPGGRDDVHVRLDRLLANLGYGSRNDVRVAISRGRVRLDGAVVRDCGAGIGDPLEVQFDGAPLEDPGPILVMLHKPLATVCSHDTREGVRVFDLLPPRWLARNPQVVTVGRLDRDTTGLLLVTDDHALVHALTAPKRHVHKRYLATLDRPVTAEAIECFAGGTIVLDGETSPCRPAVVERVEGTTVAVTLHEGRYHQVRRMFAACGFHVIALHRTHFGHHVLGDLGVGAWRPADISPQRLSTEIT